MSRLRQCRAMVEAAIAEMGGLDFLINNAGTSGTADKILPGDLDKMTEEFWQLLLNTNLIGAFRCAHAAAPALKASAAAPSSTSPRSPGSASRAVDRSGVASKSGLVSLTRSLARGLASRCG
ncbi:MAG: SDR family oxidoreductase [Paracoccaceae bacterium]